MPNILTGTIAAVALAGAVVFTAGPASAQVAGPRIATQFDQHVGSATAVRWRGRGWRGGWGPGAGFAAGVLLGGALLAPRYYDPYPYAAYRYRPYPYDPEVAYCMRRFKSYDPYSGTYLGYDGLRHPCP